MTTEISPLQLSDKEDMVEQQQSFSAILSQALASSGLSLTDVVAKLDKQGLTLSAASLSYWKTGKSLPTRKSSRPVLDALEKLCSLAPGTLIEAAQADSKAHRNRQILTSKDHIRTPDNAHTQVPNDSVNVDSDIQWEYEAQREIIVDSYHISADFRQIQSEILILARVTNPSHSYLHISSYLSDDEESYDENETNLRYLEGAEVGDIIRHEGSRAITLRLDLPEERKVGDLQRVFYLLAPFRSSSPCTLSPGRHFAWPLRMYNCHIFFEGNAPENIEWVTEEAQERGDSRIKQVTAQRIKPDGNSVQISLENVKGLKGYFRWTV